MKYDQFDDILAKRVNGERLSLEEGISLYSCDLLRLGRAAHQIKEQMFPDKRVTFIVDRNISYTNVCVVDCDFCAFYRPPGHAEGYTMTHEQVFKKIEELVALGGTQALIQGGVNPELPIDYYLDLIRAVRKKFPTVHVHSFSVVEMDMIARKNRIPLIDLFKKFKEAGLNSMPGGGAEILVERVRKMISPKKATTEKWIDVMRIAHQAGLKTTATMVVGHVETIPERIEHMMVIRNLQDETKGFRAFIPWTMSPHCTPRMKHLKQTGGEDYLKTVAISRLMLDNIEHLQSGWLTEGLKLGQIALAFGCDDMGGTLIEDKVLEPTGIDATQTTREDLIRLIKEAGYTAVQRNTNYETVQVFS